MCGRYQRCESLGGNSLSDLIVFGKRAGEFAAEFAKSNSARDDRQYADRNRSSAELSNRSIASSGENPFNIQHDLQDMMQRLVGIVRNEDEMSEAVDELQKYEITVGRIVRSPEILISIRVGTRHSI